MSTISAASAGRSGKFSGKESDFRHGGEQQKSAAVESCQNISSRPNLGLSAPNKQREKKSNDGSGRNLVEDTNASHARSAINLCTLVKMIALITGVRNLKNA
jgi:hypothetical protein